MTKVVVESSGTAGVEPASTLDGSGVSPGLVVTPGTAGVVTGALGAVVAPPVHLVQIVEVDVKVTVETVVPVVTIEEPAVVIVLVTGQVVTVVYVTTVVVVSSGTAGVEPASTLEGPGDDDGTTVTAGVVSESAGLVSVITGEEPGPTGVVWGMPGAVVEPVHLVQMTEVEVRVTVETVVPVVTIDEPPVVTVLVTGQVVTVV